MMMKIGILGGTFNPIHRAHIQMAEIARDALGLDKVLLMVAKDPPHKTVDGHVPGLQRLEMVRLAAAGRDRLSACDLEMKREGKSYTADTLAALTGLYPGAKLYLIVGSDMLRDLPNWYHPERVAALSDIACVPRKGESATDRAAVECLYETYRESVTLLPMEAEKISSTDVRARMASGLPVDQLLCPAVERFCYEEGLYFLPEVRRMQARLRENLKPSRFRHTMGCVRTAAALSAAWGGKPAKAQIGALLHDCAKYLDPVTLSVLSGDDTEVMPVWHAFAGAVVAMEAYGVTDPSILRAIRLHSTGDANMALLDQILYLADLTEPTRDYPGVGEMRKALRLGPDGAMAMALSRSREYVKACGGVFHPASMRAITYYQKKEYQKEEEH